MNTKIMNMVRIFDGENVLILDKKIKYGWEGLTFPGGKVDKNESFHDSAIREIKEETNLDIKNLEFNGMIQWIDLDKNTRDVGLLYTSREYSGNLIEVNIEGNLFFENYKKFLSMENKSESMDYILEIYEDQYFEILIYFLDGKIHEIKKY